MRIVSGRLTEENRNFYYMFGLMSEMIKHKIVQIMQGMNFIFGTSLD
jgi:hypothetical protein